MDAAGIDPVNLSDEDLTRELESLHSTRHVNAEDVVERARGEAERAGRK